MRKLTTLLLTLLAACGVARADNDALMRFAGNIHQFNELFPQEKVYLQFDNTAYFQGETIWFKAFVVLSSDLKRAPSTILYVDLVSPNGVLLQQQKVKILAGQADGCIQLLDNSTAQARELRGIQPYPSGFYEIRAYTQYMLNFDDDIIFSRVLPVYKTPKTEGDYSNPVMAPDSAIFGQNRPDGDRTRAVNVAFYPEGGHMVRGLKSRVAFKATDENGMGLEGTLSLTTDEGMQIEARSGHEGMGSFYIEPGRGRTGAEFTCGGKTYRVTMPAAQVGGYIMTADNVKDPKTLDLSITRSEARIERTVGLTVTCRGELFMFRELAMKDGENRFQFNTGDWPAGVCRIVLFTDRGEVLAARSIYNTGTRYAPPTIKVKPDRQRYGAFSKICLSLELKDRGGQPFRDRFCLSVRDAADYGTAYADNLLTDFLLTSDLKGFIHNPSYYFESDDRRHLQDLDNLCMVQGWERYDWEFMTDNRMFNETKRLEDSLSLNGWIMSNNIGKDRNLDNVKIYVAVVPRTNDNLELGQAVTGQDGYFGFNMRDFYGSADLTMRLAKADDVSKEPRAKIRMDRAYTPAIRAFRNEELQLGWKRSAAAVRNADDDDFPTIINENQGVALPTVNIDEKRKYVDYFTFHAFDVGKDVETELDFGKYTTDVTGYLIDKGYTVWCPPVNTIWVDVNSSTPDYNLADGAMPSTHTYVFSEDYPYFYHGSVDAYLNNSSAYHNVLNNIPYNPSEQEMRDMINGSFQVDGRTVVWYVHDDHRYFRDGEYSQPWTIDTQDIESILVFDKPMSIDEIEEHAPLMSKYMVTSGEMGNMLFHGLSSSTDRIWQLVDIRLKDNAQILSRKDKMNLGKRITTLTGLTRSHQFYSPEYPNGAIPGDVDYRRTLYWNPNVVTDSLGRAQVEFYNNSYSTKFAVSGCGITAGGSPYVLEEDF